MQYIFKRQCYYRVKWLVCMLLCVSTYVSIRSPNCSCLAKSSVLIEIVRTERLRRFFKLTNSLGSGEESAVSLALIPDTGEDFLIPNLTWVAASLDGDELFRRCVVFALVVVLTVAWVTQQAIDAVGAGHHRTVNYTANGERIATLYSFWLKLILFSIFFDTLFCVDGNSDVCFLN